MGLPLRATALSVPGRCVVRLWRGTIPVAQAGVRPHDEEVGPAVPTTLRAQLEWSNAAPYAARTAVAAWLATIDCDVDTRHDVELVVSELVNRAVNDHIGIEPEN